MFHVLTEVDNVTVFAINGNLKGLTLLNKMQTIPKRISYVRGHMNCVREKKINVCMEEFVFNSGVIYYLQLAVVDAGAIKGNFAYTGVLNTLKFAAHQKAIRS